MEKVLKQIPSFLVIVDSLGLFVMICFVLFLICANPTSCWECQFRNLVSGMNVSKYPAVPMYNKPHAGSWHPAPQTFQLLLFFYKLNLCLLSPVYLLTFISQGVVAEGACLPSADKSIRSRGQITSSELILVPWLNWNIRYFSTTSSCV